MHQDPTRHLAAVMFTDIVGYSALMQRNEDAARMARARHRNALSKAVLQPEGKILQYFGDGSLSVFISAAAAARAALQIQRDLKRAPGVPLRIGIHYGPVAYDEQGAYGDSVNVAARIESLSVGGGVLVSAAFHDQIAEHPDLTADPLGQVGLKNIREPVMLYALTGGGLAVPDPEDVLRRARGGTKADVPVFPGADELHIVRLLGEGGRGRVYLGREVALDRMVAVKMLRPELFRDDVARKRFEREARSTAKLSHPNVASMYRVGETEENVPYLVMEYVKGQNLAQAIGDAGPFPPEDALVVLAQLASALAAAHKAGVIHRDVKPANVVWDEDARRAVLTDFGIAAAVEQEGEDASRLTRTGQVLGDPDSMSPEQLLGEPLTEATDVYSLGLLGYRLLTQSGPYPESSTVDLALAHLQKEPRPLGDLAPGTDPELADLLARCLSKRPEDRPAAAELERAFSDLRSSDRSAAEPPATIAPGEQSRAGSPIKVGPGGFRPTVAAGIAAILIAVVLGWMLLS